MYPVPDSELFEQDLNELNQLSSVNALSKARGNEAYVAIFVDCQRTSNRLKQVLIRSNFEFEQIV